MGVVRKGSRVFTTTAHVSNLKSLKTVGKQGNQEAPFIDREDDVDEVRHGAEMEEHSKTCQQNESTEQLSVNTTYTTETPTPIDVPRRGEDYQRRLPTLPFTRVPSIKKKNYIYVFFFNIQFKLWTKSVLFNNYYFVFVVLSQ